MTIFRIGDQLCVNIGHVVAVGPVTEMRLDSWGFTILLSPGKQNGDNTFYPKFVGEDEARKAREALCQAMSPHICTYTEKKNKKTTITRKKELRNTVLEEAAMLCEAEVRFREEAAERLNACFQFDKSGYWVDSATGAQRCVERIRKMMGDRFDDCF